MDTKSKVLVIGATGYIGKFIALASHAQRHPTYALIRPVTLESKSEIIETLRNSGITILKGSVDDHESLVFALKQVDVVVSAIGGRHVRDQHKIIKAIKEVGHIKRFLPSEFGNDVDRVDALEPAQSFFNTKIEIRRAIEEASIPHTYVVNYGFFEYLLCHSTYFLASPVQKENSLRTLTNKVKIYGNGDFKFINNIEPCIGAFIIKAIDDPRTLNKTLHIRPPENIMTWNELLILWGRTIGQPLEKEIITEEYLKKLIDEAPPEESIHFAIVHDIVFKGDQCNFELGEHDVEATSLYPEVKYITVAEYLQSLLYS